MKLLSVLIIVMALVSCNYSLNKIDQPVSAHTQSTLIKSKHLGVFQAEYQPMKVYINDSIQFEITEAWVEYVYYYGQLENDSTLKKGFKPMNGTHLSFCINGDFLKKYKGLGENWEFVGISLVPPKSLSKNQFTYCATYNDQYDYPYPDSIEVRLEYSIPSLDTNKFDETHDLGKFYLLKK